MAPHKLDGRPISHDSHKRFASGQPATTDLLNFSGVSLEKPFNLVAALIFPINTQTGGVNETFPFAPVNLDKQARIPRPRLI